MNNSIYSKNPLLKRAESALDRVFSLFCRGAVFAPLFDDQKAATEKQSQTALGTFAAKKYINPGSPGDPSFAQGRAKNKTKKTHNKEITDKL